MPISSDIVICGAGIAGISAAYFLSERGFSNVLIVDERGPLELTSSQSTECYRNWWPDPDMVALMNRSIDLLDHLARDTGNAFGMNRRGYLYLTANPARVSGMVERAHRISGLGAGPIRIHSEGKSTYAAGGPPAPEGPEDGADILLGNGLIRHHFPGITEQAIAALHVRRAGWLSAQQLGMIMLEAAKRRGIRFLRARVEAIEQVGGRVAGVRLSNGEKVGTANFVNAAGPFFSVVGRLAGIELPVQTELHLKVVFRDPLGIINRAAPLLIWDDPQHLPWEKDEREMLRSEESTAWLTQAFPSGAHTRPEGGDGSQNALMLWEYENKFMDPVWPVPVDAQYAEVVLRGLSSMLPGLRRYFGRAPRPQVDGGYYTKTPENRALVGPTELTGYYVLGALSGYGIMSACGVGDLLASALAGEKLPDYAAAFALDRYNDPAYLVKARERADDGQL